MADKISPLKQESPSEGSQLDLFPVDADPNEDSINTRGVFVQDDVSDDETTFVSREGADMQFSDQKVGLVTLEDLVGGVVVATSLNRLVITTYGGVVYDLNGFVVQKENP